MIVTELTHPDCPKTKTEQFLSQSHNTLSPIISIGMLWTHQLIIQVSYLVSHCSTDYGINSLDSSFIIIYDIRFFIFIRTSILKKDGK